MAKTWVLDAETKGTGANMVPLGQVLKSAVHEVVPGFRFSKPEPPPPTHGTRRPLKFKVIDIMTREVLAEDAVARTTVNVLDGVHSIIDVTVYVWDPKGERWRMLTSGETRALWNTDNASNS